MIQNINVGHSMTVVSSKMLSQLIHTRTKSNLTFQRETDQHSESYRSKRGKSSHARGLTSPEFSLEKKWVRQNQLVLEGSTMLNNSKRQFTECIRYIFIKDILRMPEKASEMVNR